jgi:hypothetical protein
LLLLVLPNEGVSESNEETELKAVCDEKRSDTEVISGSLVGFVKLVPCELENLLLGRARLTNGDAMLPTQAPNQIVPETSIFLVCPAVLEVMTERKMTNDAWYDPVK